MPVAATRGSYVGLPVPLLLVVSLAACQKSKAHRAPDLLSAAASAAASAEACGDAAPFTPRLVHFRSGALTLGGYLYRPPGKGPFPAIVFDHGSERPPGAKEGQAMFYVEHGYLLFVPHRRGQGQSLHEGAYIGSYWNPTASDSPAFTDALVAQSDDVMAAIAYVAALPCVDPKRVATVGCSLGGIESLLAAERGTGIVGAVDFAGGAIMWAKSASLRARMKIAARNAKVPVFFIQADNDYDTSPSRVLSAAMKQAGKPMRVHIFPPHGFGFEEGHAFCLGGSRPPWGDEVLAFLDDVMHR